MITLQEQYSLLFTDTMMSNLAFSINADVVFHTIAIFNFHNLYLVIPIATFGFFCASLINYPLGVIVGKILKPIKSRTMEDNRKHNLSIFHSKYRFLAYIMSATPFLGKFIILFIGISRSLIDDNSSSTTEDSKENTNKSRSKLDIILIFLISTTSKLIYYSVLYFFLQYK